MRRQFHRQVELENWALDYAFAPSVPAPDDWPDCAGIQSSGLVPFYQGDHLTSLSAAFAAVNAIRLLVFCHAPLKPKQEAALLEAAWLWAKGRQTLEPGRGLRKSDLPRLVGSLCEWVSRYHGQSIRVSQPWRDESQDPLEFLASVERLIVSQHVLLGLLVGGRYSVIRGYTAKSLLLFDSGGRCWIERGSVAVGRSSRSAKHRIAPTSTLALRRSF